MGSANRGCDTPALVLLCEGMGGREGRQRDVGKGEMEGRETEGRKGEREGGREREGERQREGEKEGWR